MELALPPLDLTPEARKALGAPVLAPALESAVAHAWTHAPYLKGLLRTRTATFARIVEAGFDAALADAFAAARGEGAVEDRLRFAKADVALVTALADLSGAWPLERVTAALSDFADLALDAAVAAALAERGAGSEGFTVLALGKLGSRELNYSSDVDLILLYEPAAMPLRGRDEPGDVAVRIARRVVAIMEAPGPAGYVFRTDLRLRPSWEATPIALPFAAAESYYQSEAQTWERVAFIRARACAGDVARGRQFLADIRPFVWRRSLDYTAIRDIQAVSLRIRDHFERGQEVGPHFDVKRGRGGIREAEFYVQIHQMVWGGRQLGLRAPATLDALAALAAAGRIDRTAADAIAPGYRLLRMVEHRLQMRADEQTHEVPGNAAHRTAVARLCGQPDWRSLERRLRSATRRIAAVYDELVAEAGGERVPAEPAALKAWLKTAKLPPDLAGLVANWRSGRYRALRTEAPAAAFEQLLPALLRMLGAAADPGHAAARFDAFLAGLPAGLQFFALLEANPRLIGLLGGLLGVTPVLADALSRDPALIDVLLAPDSFDPLPDAAGLAAELASVLRGAVLLEDTLDRVRRWTGERRFQIGAQLVERRLDPLVAARNLADLADAALQALHAAVSADFARAHGTVEGVDLIVLAMGRYGGRALTHASDLDLVYLFGGDHFGVSDGDKPLAATLYFNRLASRLTAALSVPTAAGALYEVDTRLRPSGGQGLLAVSVESFARYQREEAWTWEHLALTRARVVAGDAAAIEPVVSEILARPRDPETLRSDVLTMRGEIDAAKPGHGLWDVKLGKGGLVDIEFIVHFLQLRDKIGLRPELGPALAELAAAGRVPAGLKDAHDLLTRLLVILRLVVADTSGKVGALGAQVAALLADTAGCGDLAAVEAAITLAKRTVIGAWETTFDRKR